MNISEKLRAYGILHFCVLIWGFTAILGKLIQLQALPLVWWRVVLCTVALFLMVGATQRRAPGRGGILRMLGIGTIIGLHWICFYGAIKWSNASVAVATMAMTSFFSALTEPVLLRRKWIWHELLISAMVLPGMFLITGGLQWEMQKGLFTGVTAAALAAVFTTLNKKEIDLHGPAPLVMSLYEMTGAVLVTSTALLVVQPGWALFMPQREDWLWLFLLAFVCTLLPQYLVLKVMRHLSAFSVNLTTNLEPVYGIALAALFFREDQTLGAQFYLGVIIVILAVFSHPFLKQWLLKKNGSKL